MGDEFKSGGDLKRSKRNDWGKSIEELIRHFAPFPISYDVDCTQSLNFSEFSYTEILGGMYINTQNTDTNCRIIESASKEKTKIDHIANIKKISADKYDLVSIDKNYDYPKKIGFMVGHNMFDMVSRENVARIAFENDDFKLKLHPLTNQNYAGKIASTIGWNKIIQNDVSGVALLKNAESVYTTTSSELGLMAVAYDKDIHNITAFFNESIGVYYPISKLLFTAERNRRKTILNNIIDCKYSGILFPWMTDVEERINAYYKKALEVREIYKPLSIPSELKKTPCDPNA